MIFYPFHWVFFCWLFWRLIPSQNFSLAVSLCIVFSFNFYFSNPNSFLFWHGWKIKHQSIIFFSLKNFFTSMFWLFSIKFSCFHFLSWNPSFLIQNLQIFILIILHISSYFRWNFHPFYDLQISISILSIPLKFWLQNFILACFWPKVLFEKAPILIIHHH